MREAIAIGLLVAAGAGVALLIRRGSRIVGEGKLGGTSAGVKGSPFYVKCTFDQEVFDSTMDLFSDSTFKDERRIEMAKFSASDCEWGCVDDREVKAAQFRNLENPKEWAILAPSAKVPGKWQLSWFDERGPRGDSPRDTQCDAIKELSSGYKYQGSTMFVDGEVRSDWVLEKWK